MKPQNYSLKFQNSLADSRITPGSQPGKGPAANAPKVRNGQRAARKLTKYEKSKAKQGISKTHRKAPLNTVSTVSSSVTVSGDTNTHDYARRRAIEKAIEAKCAATMTGILKTAKPKPEALQQVGSEEEWAGIVDSNDTKLSQTDSS